MFKCVSASVSDVGTVRLVNEDSHLDCASQGLWLIADGMGGHFAGDYASQAIVNAFAGCQLDAGSIVHSLNQIDDILAGVNEHLLDYAKLNHKRIVGSTLVLLLLRAEIGVCIWVGDSRLYRVRDAQMECMTSDHSLIQELIDRGDLTVEEGLRHPARNVITRAVGSELLVKSDICVFDPKVKDLYLLCSDGLYNVVSQDRMRDVMCENNIQDAVNVLLSDALRLGADDNVTLIGVGVDDVN